MWCLVLPTVYKTRFRSMAFARTEDRPTMGHCSHHDSSVGSPGAPTMNLPTIVSPDLADSQTSNAGDCIVGDMETCRCCDTHHESTATHWIGKAGQLTMQKLEYHWQDYNTIHHSALPLRAFAKYTWHTVTKHN